MSTSFFQCFYFANKVSQPRAKFCRSGINDEQQVVPRRQTGSVPEGADSPHSRLFSPIRISGHLL